MLDNLPPMAIGYFQRLVGSSRDTVKGVFLLILAIAGNFVAETLGCRTRELLTNNMYAKHLVSVFILYFSIGLFHKKDKHPSETIKATVLVYFIFILFTKMDLKITILVFILLATYYINWTYIDYYKTLEEDKYQKKSEQLLALQKSLFSLIGILIIYGFTSYLKRQYNEYSEEWSTIKFLFGVKNCKSLQ